ncbi:Redoxin-domain-containing protein [Phellopilus nigrolimitatus]|nr:Redoxin-domain-containing protein [Phellopilus nigrolimitatus]
MASILASTAHAAHAAAGSFLGAAPVAVGGALPAAPTVKELDPEKGFALGKEGGRVVIVGVPGAFTPPCSSQVPGYIEKADAFAARGVKAIYVVAVNDAFVTQAWKEKLTGGKPTSVRFVADDKGEFTAGVGMLFDASGLLGGPRSKRYVLVAEDGKVTHVAVEESPPDVSVTKADAILAQL